MSLSPHRRRASQDPETHSENAACRQPLLPGPSHPTFVNNTEVTKLGSRVCRALAEPAGTSARGQDATSRSAEARGVNQESGVRAGTAMGSPCPVSRPSPISLRPPDPLPAHPANPSLVPYPPVHGPPIRPSPRFTLTCPRPLTGFCPSQPTPSRPVFGAACAVTSGEPHLLKQAAPRRV